jgi:hypothetical protein
MRRLLPSILLLLALVGLASTQAQAALTVTARGTGGNNTGATTLVVTPASNLAAGSAGVLVVALDNAGSGGASPTTGASETDSVGNVWTRRANPIYDPGAASAGVEVAFFTATLTTALTTSNSLTLNFANTVTAKAWALWEVAPGAGKIVSYVTGAAGTGSATGTPTVTTGSITNGDVVIGGGGAESANTWTGDSDTTNGNWSTQQANGFGTGTSGMSVTSQAKVVTADATQTYNPTLTSADTILGWVQLKEASPSTAHFFFLFN